MTVKKLRINLPDIVENLINSITDAGYEAFAVGGCIRDSLLGIEPHDWDIATSAMPSDIQKIFEGYQLIEVGKAHGTIGVVIDKKVYEITTYRIDGDYNDNRHPESVTFAKCIEDDLSRRDYTINSMAYNHDKGLVDPFNGQEDLKFKAIRCVGDPDTRFNEDALRILRGLRFSSVYNFSISSATSTSIIKNRMLLNNISKERISSELTKLLCGDNVQFILNRYKDVFAVFLPEIVSTFDFSQNNPHHNKTVWRHITASVANIEPDSTLRLVMLLHDIGKPLALVTDEKGVDHFKGHNHFGAVLAKNALERLKYPNKLIDDICVLIEYHDVRFSDDKKKIKHVLNLIGEYNFSRLLKVQYADMLAQSKYMRDIKLHNHEIAKKAFFEIIENNECYSLKNLAINGSDIIHLGITDGKMIGDILNSILDEVIDGTIDNDAVLLKKKAIELYAEKKDKLPQ